MIEEEVFNGYDDNEEDVCPFVEDIMTAALAPKPFGLMWSQEAVIDFLKKLGYKVIGDSIAVKPGDKEVPDENNLMKVFNDEVSKIMTKWLLKINTEL